MTQDKWLSLVRELKVTGAKESSCSASEVKRLEVELGVIFPVGYKEYCEVFGAGELGGFIRVFCPCFTDVPEQARNTTFTLGSLQGSGGLEALEQELDWETDRQIKGHSRVDGTRLSLLKRILSQAFAFGDDPNAHIYMWDLTSYNDSDRSCDIYMVPTDDLDGTRLVGRDFFEFVHDFCLGSKASEVLPPRFSFHEEFTGKTFLRFDKKVLNA